MQSLGLRRERQAQRTQQHSAVPAGSPGWRPLYQGQSGVWGLSAGERAWVLKAWPADEVTAKRWPNACFHGCAGLGRKRSGG